MKDEYLCLQTCDLPHVLFLLLNLQLSCLYFLAFLNLSPFSHFICLADATQIQIWNPRDLRWVNRFRCLFLQHFSIYFWRIILFPELIHSFLNVLWAELFLHSALSTQFNRSGDHLLLSFIYLIYYQIRNMFLYERCATFLTFPHLHFASLLQLPTFSRFILSSFTFFSKFLSRFIFFSEWRHLSLFLPNVPNSKLNHLRDMCIYLWNFVYFEKTSSILLLSNFIWNKTLDSNPARNTFSMTLCMCTIV